jgi:WD40 repeat protein
MANVMAAHLPITSDSFFVTGGTLPIEAGSYVVRQADTDLFESLREGEFCYVLNTRQMGKSSLMVRTAVRLRAAGFSVAVLDLTAIGQNLTAEQWYDGLLSRLGRQLEVEDQLDDFFRKQAKLGPMQRFMDAVAAVALPRFQPLIIFIDEIDAVRSLPFSVDEFFAGIRECHNRRADDPLYRGLTFCLLGVATPSDLVTDTRMSPFNIGRRIELTDFTAEEAAPLAEGLAVRPHSAGGESERSGAALRLDAVQPPTRGIDTDLQVNGTAAGADPGASGTEPRREPDRYARQMLARVLYWTAGHPYMTQRLCRAVAAALTDGPPASNGASGTFSPSARLAALTHARSPAAGELVDGLVASLFFSKSARESDDNLAFVRNRLLRSEVDVPALLDLYREVRVGRKVPDDETSEFVSILRLSGIVKVESGVLAVRNRIYAHVFDPRWIAANMPDAELQRQRAAYRAGILRAAFIAGAVVLVMGVLAATSIVWKQRAEQSAQVANQEAQKSRVSAAKAFLSEQRERESERRANELVLSERAEKQKALDFGGALAQTFDKLTREQKIAQANYGKAQRSAARASRAESVQKEETKRLNHVLYDATMNLVQREYEAHEYSRMQDLLNQTRNADDRGFEWRFWQGLCPLQHSINAHAGEVLCVAPAPDGNRFATGGADRTVAICDGASGRILQRWTEDAEVRSAAFSPDGRRLAVGLAGQGKPGRALVRDADTGRALVTLPVAGAVWSVAYSHDGKTIATNGDRVQTWDSGSGDAIEDYGPGGPAIVFAPDDTRICFSRWSESGKAAEVDVLDMGEGVVTFSLSGQMASGQVRGIAWSSDDTKIATGGDDRMVRLWNASSGQFLRALAGHSEAVISASFSPDGKRLVTSSLDDEARVWDLNAPAPGIPPGPQGNPRLRPGLRNARAFGQENRLLFKHARQAVFTADSHHIVTGSYAGMVRVWSGAPSPSYLVLDGPPVVSLDHVGAVAFAPNNRLVVASIDSPIGTLWDAVAGTRLRDLRGHAGEISALAFFPDGSRVVSGGWDGAVKVWDSGSSRSSFTLQGHHGNIHALAVSSDGRIVSVGEDRTGIVWDSRSRKRVATLNLSGAVAHGVAFSPDGTRIAVAQTDNAMAGRITLWDASSGKLLRTIASLPSRILAVRFSPDGTRILAGVDDRTARIWDVASGRLLLTLRGHTSGVNSVAFSSDGRRVVTGSFDTTAKLWDARTGREILTLHHPTFVVGVALSPDRRRIVTACEDGSTRVWTAE